MFGLMAASARRLAVGAGRSSSTGAGRVNRSPRAAPEGFDPRVAVLPDPDLEAVDPELRALQAEYEAWRDQLPESLADSRTAELLEGVCDVDLDQLDVELPGGFGRD